MTHDELLARIELTLGTYISKYYGRRKDVELRANVLDLLQALRAVVELMKKEQDWLESTKGDMPMTDEWVFRRAERWWLLAKFNFAIEKELT